MKDNLGKIDILDTIEEDDGSLTIVYTMDDDSKKLMAELGTQFALYCAAADVNIQDALNNIVKDLKED